MTDAAIRLSNVTKRFGVTTAVDDLSLAVPTGSIYGFIGPNGSGKTTTLRMIMHILLPDQGQIEVLGSPDTAAAYIAMARLTADRALAAGLLKPEAAVALLDVLAGGSR